MSIQDAGADGITQAGVIEMLKCQGGNKSVEQSVRNQLSALKKAGKVSHEGTTYKWIVDAA